MRNRPSSKRSDILIMVAGPLLGLLVWLLTGEWRWFPTGLLVSATGGALAYARQRRLTWGIASGVIALPTGLALWLWLGDSRWAILGLFPIVFVLISWIATAIERRR